MNCVRCGEEVVAASPESQDHAARILWVDEGGGHWCHPRVGGVHLHSPECTKVCSRCHPSYPCDSGCSLCERWRQRQ